MLNSLYFKGEKVFTIELVECLQTLFFHFPCSARYFPSSIIKLQNNKNYVILILNLTFKCTKVNKCILPMATYIMSNVYDRKVLFGVSRYIRSNVNQQMLQGHCGKDSGNESNIFSVDWGINQKRTEND